MQEISNKYSNQTTLYNTIIAIRALIFLRNLQHKRTAWLTKQPEKHYPL